MLGCFACFHNWQKYFIFGSKRYVYFNYHLSANLLTLWFILEARISLFLPKEMISTGHSFCRILIVPHRRRPVYSHSNLTISPFWSRRTHFPIRHQEEKNNLKNPLDWWQISEENRIFIYLSNWRKLQHWCTYKKSLWCICLKHT